MNHTDSSLLSFKKQVILTNIPFLVLLGAITAVINGLLLWAIMKDPLRTFSKPKIIIDSWMSWSEFLSGTILVPLIVTDEILNGVYGKEYSELSTAVVVITRFLFGAGNVFVMMSILEGTGGILNPHFVRRVTTKQNVITAVLITLGVTFIYSLLLVVGVPEKVHSTIYIHIFMLLPVLIATAMFIKTYERIRNPRKVVPTTNPSAYHKEKLKMNRLRNEKISKNFIKTIAVFFTPFLISSLSYYIFIMIITFSMSDNTCENNRWCVVHKRMMLSSLFIHSAFTPIAFTYKISEYRNAVSYVLRKTTAKICRR